MSKQVLSISSRDVAAIAWSASLDEARALMAAKRIRHLPVVDERGEIVGVLSDRDLQRAMRVERADLWSGCPSDSQFDPSDAVRDWMTWPVASIDASASIADAARAMVDRRISCLLVARDGELAGVVTTTDLLRTLIAESEGPLERAAGALDVAFTRWPVGQIAHALGNAGI